ncbi:MAG: hypothetical protein ACFUZC_08810 [Chthoniobacteraceae bacterium]
MMLTARSHSICGNAASAHTRRPERGFAIVLVLGFVVLLTTLVIAFFSRALLNRQVADTSANMERADLFAQGALDMVVGDVKQEIAARSATSATITTGNTVAVTTGNTVAVIYTGSNALPSLVGFSGTAGLENLLKISCAGSPFFTGGPARAAAVSSTTASLNGRYISLARWNKPLFLGKAKPDSDTDLKPVGSFSAPDWVLVARDGSNPTAPSGDVVGRYAYAIYHEGGVLDVNVAGYPSSMAPAETAYKQVTAYADLTQTGMTSPQVDALVNWRNAATLQSGASGYAKYVMANPVGFLTTSGTALSGGQSDRMFVSRQQLIDFFNLNLGGGATLQKTLQCLGTFSRDLNQPSLSPDPSRPKVVSDAGLYLGTGNLFDSNAGGNDGGYGDDDNINPSFLNIRATNTFGRNDGSTAVTGEPLVKKRFPLSRLAWLTCAGPITLDGNSYNPGLDASFIASLKSKSGLDDAYLLKGTADNIYKSFGLSWDASGKAWTYDHGITSGAIGRLMDIQSKSREADFFELLKASITVGVLGKGSAANSCQYGSNLAPCTVDALQYRHDTGVDYQIIQIGANIIDQADLDGYPTHIIFDSYDFYGVENLPYLYRARAVGINTSGTSGVRVLLPEVWNPHDKNASAGTPSPSAFRFLLVGSGLSPSVITLGGARYAPTNSIQWDSNNLGNVAYSASLDTSASVANGLTELNFSGTAAGLFSEPVFIGGLKNSAQSGSISLISGTSNSLRAYPGSSSGYLADTYSNLSYCGVKLGDFNSIFIIKSGTNTTTYPLSGAGNPSPGGDLCRASSSPEQAHYVLQYQSDSGWVTYQQNDAALPFAAEVSNLRGFNSTNPRTIDISVMTTGTQMSASYGSPDTGDIQTWMDPRTSRFGAFNNQYQSSLWTTYHQWLTSPYYGNSNRPDGGAGLMCGFGSGLPGQGMQLFSTSNNGGMAQQIGWYPGTWKGAPGYFVPGYYAENVPNTRSYPKNAIYCFTDPDGVARRGMSGYVSTGTNSTVGMPMANTGLSATQTQSRPLILNRPFRMVAELGYVFSDTPWRNLDFCTPESGFTGLLDVFCIGETYDPAGRSAGKPNLNTRQVSVIRALLAGMNNQGNAYKDEFNPGGTGTTDALTSTEISQIAQAFCDRTASPDPKKGPLENNCELVGKWTGKVVFAGVTPHNIDGSQSYSGFAGDLTSLVADANSPKIQRFREAAIRALSASGQTRVWNLMIDLVAQTGRYRKGETSLARFSVDGERRYWLHIAIDRCTGDIIDKQLELVEE